MQIINKINVLTICLFILFLLNSATYADEFNISATEITVDAQNDIVKGVGNVKVTDLEGKIITSDKVIYEKKREFLIVEGSVNVSDKEGNTLITDKAEFDKIANIISTFNNTKLLFDNGYQLISSDIKYDNTNKIVSSKEKTSISDDEGNVINAESFQYQLNKNLLSSIGKIEILDMNNNKYFFKELFIDTKRKEMVGSDVSVVLDNKNVDFNDENEPRFVANDIFVSKNKSNLSKGVFTVCKERKDKCPPWSLQAKEISHDKIKKTIYYKNATLKVYGVPIFYFPRFFHPDPTVKRKSGFLTPSFSNSSSLGLGFDLPYYWAINSDKDMTITPRLYAKENILLLNEYRQAYDKGFLTLDYSYTQGYKETSSKKTKGSRNHIFAELDINLTENESYKSDLSFKLQKVSNDTFFRVHNINTTLVNSEDTDLENSISYKLNGENTYFDISATAYENLRNKTNDRYEYILPNIMYGKTFFTERFGTVDLNSSALYKNYSGNKYNTLQTNEIIWNPGSTISKNGFVNTLQGVFKNTNYEAKNTSDYRVGSVVNEFAGVLSYKKSLPMRKEGKNNSKTISPNFMIRYAPSHMRNLSDNDVYLNYSNLYATNKTSEIERGLSTILGFDYKINEKKQDGSEREKIAISLGQVFSADENKDIPSKSSLDQKSSDIVGVATYNFSKVGKIDYKFSLDHNLNNLNYNQVSTSLNFGKIDFNLDYLEESNHVGTEHYVNSGVTLNFNNSNKLSFSTKKNFKTESTELYNLSYQYMNDCLTAGLVFRREFYEDVTNDIEPKDSLMFMITIVPFGPVATPALKP